MATAAKPGAAGLLDKESGPLSPTSRPSRARVALNLGAQTDRGARPTGGGGGAASARGPPTSARARSPPSAGHGGSAVPAVRLTPRGRALEKATDGPIGPTATVLIAARERYDDRLLGHKRRIVEDRWHEAQVEWQNAWNSQLFERERLEQEAHERLRLEEARLKLEAHQAERDDDMRRQVNAELLRREPQVPLLEQQVDAYQKQLEREKQKHADELEAKLARLRREMRSEHEAERVQWKLAQKEGALEGSYVSAARRMRHAGVLHGWTAWHEQWANYRRQKRLLSRSAEKLGAPKLRGCFHFWRELQQRRAKLREKGSLEARLHDERREAERRFGRERAALAAATQQAAAEAEAKRAADAAQLAAKVKRAAAKAAVAEACLRRAVAEAEEAEQAAVRWGEEEARVASEAVGRANARREAVERQLAEALGGQADASRRDEMRQAQERQERIATMQAKAMRRLGSAGIVAGWTAWEAAWQEASRHRRVVAAAAAKLSRPLVVAVFATWRAEWEAYEASIRNKTQSQLARELETSFAAQLQSLRQQHDAALRAEVGRRQQLEAKLLGVDGTIAQTQAELEAKIALERERRVEALHKKAAFRLGKQTLLRGWGAWVEQATERRRMLRLLTNASNVLSKPKLHGGFGLWKGVCAARKRAAQAQGSFEALHRLEEQQERAAQLQRQLDETRRKLAQAEEVAEEKLAQRIAEERHKYSERLFVQSARRLVHRGLSAAWAAWHGEWVDVVRRQRLMRDASLRICKPRMISGFGWWRTDYERQKRDAAQSDAERKLRAAASEAEAALKREKRAAAEARLLLEQAVRDLERRLEQRTRVQVPEQLPRVLVLHDVSARGVPNSDANGSGSDPYARFVLLDHDGEKKETCTTSYFPNESDPSWDGERLQLQLAPGGARPPVLRVEVWDNDQHHPDELIGAAEVTLSEGGFGQHLLRLKGHDGLPDVPQFRFAFSLSVDPEPEQAQPKRWRAGGGGGGVSRHLRAHSGGGAGRHAAASSSSAQSRGGGTPRDFSAPTKASALKVVAPTAAAAAASSSSSQSEADASSWRRSRHSSLSTSLRATTDAKSK